MVELIDDHDVEVVRARCSRLAAVRLWIDANTCSKAMGRAPPTHSLAERVVAHRVPEHRQALLQDLLSGARRRAAAPAGTCPQPRIVDRRHDRLAGAGRRHEQIAVVAARTGQLDKLEHPFLKGLEPHLKRAEHRQPSLGGSAGSGRERRGTRLGVGDEVAALPVAVEDRFDLLNDVDVPRGGDPHVPLQARHLRRVRQIG